MDEFYITTKMTIKNKFKPTVSEIKILDVIWALKSATVREVYNKLSEFEKVGYTTVLKFMQIMTDKGFLEKDDTVRPQIYKPAVPQKETQRSLVRDLLERAFGGSAGSLVIQALSMKNTTREELHEIRELIDQLEEDAT